MRATEKGLALARKLGPAVGFTAETNRICSLICRNIATWHTLAEKAESAGLLADAGNAGGGRIVRQQYRTEKRLETLVSSLPVTDCGPWRLDLTRGPRGNGLLLLPDGCACIHADDRDRRGVVIP